MSSERIKVRLKDIENNAIRLKNHIKGIKKAEFMESQLLLDAVERCLERISEAARVIGDRYDTAYPDMELHKLRKFGSVLRHDYYAIRPELLWLYVKTLLPGLYKMTKIELKKLSD